MSAGIPASPSVCPPSVWLQHLQKHKVTKPKIKWVGIKKQLCEDVKYVHTNTPISTNTVSCNAHERQYVAVLHKMAIYVSITLHIDPIDLKIY